MSRKLTKKEVLDRFKKVHGDEYDYSLVEYFGAHTKVKIICTKKTLQIYFWGLYLVSYLKSVKTCVLK